jgi:dTDP-4-dehydrorhamnose reductase
MRILITGASGLLGLNIALEAAPHHEVFGVAHRTPLTTKDFTVLTADLLETGTIHRVLRQARPDWVINCAALANLEACERNPELAQQINSKFPGKLASIVGKGGARLIHVSTDAVFDGTKGNYSEEDLPNPLSVYARTKLDGEYAVRAANPDAIIARVNLFGFSPGGRRSLAEFFLYNLLAEKPMKGFTDVYFCPLLVNDIAHIFLKMLKAGLQGIFHVFSSECLSKYDFGVRIARRFELDETLITPSSVSESALEAVRSPNLTMNTHKLSTALNQFSPSFPQMLDRFYALYQQGYPQRIRQLVSGA